MTEKSQLLTIDISQPDADRVVLRVFPLPPSNREVLALSSAHLFVDDIPHTRWARNEDGEKDEHICEIRGVWALGLAMGWASRAFKMVPHTLKVVADVDKVPLEFDTHVEVVFNGHRLTSADEVEAAFAADSSFSTHSLGTFKLSQPDLRITDPGYEIDTHGTYVVQAQPGGWHAQTLIGPTSWYTRVHCLQVHHESLGEQPVLPWQELEATEMCAGVDSGQCGFFDDALYPRDPDELEWEEGRFYADCCESTLSYLLPGGTTIRGFGAVSRSGFGDGGYAVYVKRNKEGQIVLAQLRFIGDSEDDE